MKNIFKIWLLFYMIVSCASQESSLQTVEYVDLEKYVGKWYEIASFPQSFQKGCHCSTAEYFLEKDYVKVVNKCKLDSINGKEKTAEGKAFLVENSNNTKLKVQFFFPFKGDYWIIDLADDYSYAVVSDPSMKYLWILSRTPQMQDSIYSDITNRLLQKGFDLSKLTITNQGCL